MTDQHDAYVALGSNIGERDVYLHGAIQQLDAHPNITIVKKSSIYETDPVGYTDQAAFLNMVIKLTTTLQPLELLDVLQGIEDTLGRTREVRWGPRTIDLDILLYNKENIKLERLHVPHPRMFERGFVLVPLYEVDQNLQFPNGQDLQHYVRDLTDKEGVRKWKRSSGADESAPFES
ncbi:2-amino-4-hydroxy-6-hydroxymethyldihydropteridine diphosphokinase [Alteribacter aurantiacus]|uniref:2-amino-4-hydroxy-6- hydroxymethyldihydropteridine diphosphokinase n=1 Tax=Alteribacter aurantiacus TaxID=254410 RepID=UPI0004212458|nr:2-amino-4-hydroxy-6-hydroxymethyldihydropteridine diphosphokinase [Alteribacter aurantiacus]